MNVDVSSIEEIAVIAVTGRVDSGNADDFEKCVVEVLDNGSKSVIIDLSATDYISSAGIRVILICAMRLQKTSGKLALSGLNEYIKNVFKIAGLDVILTIAATRDDARDLLNAVA
jgi:anti-anti-sigma factor